MGNGVKKGYQRWEPPGGSFANTVIGRANLRFRGDERRRNWFSAAIEGLFQALLRLFC